MPFGTPSGSPHRRSWILSANKALYCVRRHRIPEDAVTPLILEHGGIRCPAKVNFGPGDRPTPCGAFMWLLQMPGFRFVAEVTYEELKHISAQHFTVEQTLDYLDLEGEMIRLPAGTRHLIEAAAAADTSHRRRA